MSDLSLWLVLIGSVAMSAASVLAVSTTAVYRAEIERQARTNQGPWKRLGLLTMLLSFLITAAWVWHAVAVGNWLYGAVGLLPWVIGTVQAVVKIVWGRKARREKPPLVTVHCEPRPGESEGQTVARVQSALRIHDLLGSEVREGPVGS